MSDRATGVALALAACGLYALTLCRTLYWYDSAEYVAAAVTLGIPHPPGYPLYTLVAHVFTWLPVDPPLAVSALSAACGAVAVGLAYALGRALGAGRAGAAIGAGTLATSELFWSQAVIAEVYTPALAVLLAVTLLVVRGLAGDRPRLLWWAAALAGLGLGVHLSIATCGLGLAVMVWGNGLTIRAPRDLRLLVARDQLARRLRVSAIALGCALAGSLIFLYLPLRASMDPALNFGDPSSWDRFWWHVTGGNYGRAFDYELVFWSRAGDVLGIVFDQLLVVGAVLCAIGAARVVARRPLPGIGLLLMVAGNIGFFFDYQVHDAEVFFLSSVAVMCCLVGLGADTVIELARARIRPQRAGLRAVVVGVLCLFPMFSLVANYRVVDMSDFDEATTYAETLVRELPPNAVVLNYTSPAEWKRDAVFGFYYQKVLHARPDVRVLSSVRPPEVAELLRAGVAVYMYAPVAPILKRLAVVEEGPLLRVVGFRTRSAPSGSP